MTQAACTCPEPDAPLAVRHCCPVHCCNPDNGGRLTEVMAMTTQETCEVCGSNDAARCSFEVCCSCWRGVPCAAPIDPTDTSVCQTCGESDPYQCDCGTVEITMREWREYQALLAMRDRP